MIGATKRGIYIEGDGSFSIDQQRYNFQFGGQTFWEISDGKRTRMLRDVAYVSRARRTSGIRWRSSAAERPTGSAPRSPTRKGQPGQANAVSHGCPIALFRNVNVINTA